VLRNFIEIKIIMHYKIYTYFWLFTVIITKITSKSLSLTKREKRQNNIEKIHINQDMVNGNLLK